jgi:uncharacterized protein (DUF1015 family)
MQLLPFQGGYPNLELVPHDAAFFDAAREKYAEYKTNQQYLFANEEAIYLYHIQSKKGKEYLGLIACASIEDYLNNIIKKHEKTITHNESLQMELLKERSAAIKPVLISYPHAPEIDSYLSALNNNLPIFYQISLDGDLHIFRQIESPKQIKEVQQLFNIKVPVAYIADGHHRSASSAAYYKSGNLAASKLMCAFFGDNQMEIKPFHRLILGLNGLSEDAFLNQLKPLFKIKYLTRRAVANQPKQMTICLNGSWFSLLWRKEVYKDFVSADKTILDVHLLNDLILKPILGIKKIRSDKRIKYLDGTNSVDDLNHICRKSEKDYVLFTMFPIEFKDLVAIADSEGTMPPKSTFFEPRMRNGLFVYDM